MTLIDLAAMTATRSGQNTETRSIKKSTAIDAARIGRRATLGLCDVPAMPRPEIASNNLDACAPKAIRMPGVY